VMTDNVSLNFERFWNGIGLGFSFLSLPLCFSLLSSRTRTMPKETETERNGPQIGGIFVLGPFFCFFAGPTLLNSRRMYL
jgi:hypothetical protein